MPYIDLPSQGCRAFYVLNPLSLPTSGLWPSTLLSPPSHSTHSHSLLNGNGIPPNTSPFNRSKPTLVLLHALTMSSALFYEQFRDARLKEGMNLLGIDLRLSGMTEEREEGVRVTLEMQAEMVIAVLDALKLPSYSIYGEGFLGCTAAIWTAYKRPEKVKALILGSPAWRQESTEISSAFLDLPRHFISNKDGQGNGTGSIDEEAVIVMLDYLIGVAPRLEEKRGVYREGFEWRYGANRPSSEITQVLLWGATRTPIPEAVLEGITAPVMVFRGREDEVITPAEATEEYRRLMKNVKGGVVIHDIQGGPHCLSFTDYNIVNRMLAIFVGKNGR